MWRFENLGVGDEHMRCRLALGNQLNDGSTVKMLQNEHFHFDHRECNTDCSIQTAREDGRSAGLLLDAGWMEIAQSTGTARETIKNEDAAQRCSAWWWLTDAVLWLLLACWAEDVGTANHTKGRGRRMD